MMEAMTAGYASAFGSRHAKLPERPEPVHLVMKQAMRRSWRQLAVERIEGARATIPLGRRFWPLSAKESRAIGTLFSDEAIATLATSLKGRKDGGKVDVLDAAYWVKGCSSLDGCATRCCSTSTAT